MLQSNYKTMPLKNRSDIDQHYIVSAIVTDCSVLMVRI